MLAQDQRATLKKKTDEDMLQELRFKEGRNVSVQREFDLLWFSLEGARIFFKRTEA